MITHSDEEVRDLLRIWAMRAFGASANETALQYGVDLLQGRAPIVRQD